MSGNRTGLPHDQGEVDCARWHEAVSALVDGECPATEAAAVRAHLAGCPDCAARAEELHRLQRLLRLRAAEPAPDLAPQVRAWAGPAPAPAPGPTGPRRRLAAALVAAGALVVGALGWAGGGAGDGSGDASGDGPAAGASVEAVDAYASSAEAGGTSSLVLTLRNRGGEDALVAVGSDAAPIVELHRGGVGDRAAMRAVDLFPLGARQDRHLRLDASHLMLVDLERTLRPGTAVTVELRFERAEPLVVRARVLSDEQLLARQVRPADPGHTD